MWVWHSITARANRPPITTTRMSTSRDPCSMARRIMASMNSLGCPATPRIRSTPSRAFTSATIAGPLPTVNACAALDSGTASAASLPRRIGIWPRSAPCTCAKPRPSSNAKPAPRNRFSSTTFLTPTTTSAMRKTAIMPCPKPSTARRSRASADGRTAHPPAIGAT